MVLQKDIYIMLHTLILTVGTSLTRKNGRLELLVGCRAIDEHERDWVAMNVRALVKEDLTEIKSSGTSRQRQIAASF